MVNIEMEVNEGILTLRIDLTKTHGLSKSQKTITIASSQGNKKVPGTDAIIGLNVYKYPDK